MPRLRPALVVLSIVVLIAVAAVGSLWIAAHRERDRLRADWLAKVDRYRVQFGRGATRAEVEAELDRNGAGLQRFQGGVTNPGESRFRDSVLLGYGRDHLCGTTVYGHAVFTYRSDPLAEVVTDEPKDPLERIDLEEIDSCGAL